MIVETQDKKDSVEVSIKVKDSGIGMTDEDKLNLFAPYFKSKDKNSLSMNSGGHGLGLHIC